LKLLHRFRINDIHWVAADENTNHIFVPSTDRNLCPVIQCKIISSPLIADGPSDLTGVGMTKYCFYFFHNLLWRIVLWRKFSEKREDYARLA